MKKNAIIYGSLPENGIIENAVRRLSEIILDYTGEYPICFSDDTDSAAKESRRFYIGTAESNPAVAALAKGLERPEEYRITVADDTVTVAGHDDAGVLYGCIDLYDKYLSSIEWTGESGHYIKNPFEYN